jgi:3-deoxy-D-manno-octulosonic-acid transferase
MTAKGRFGGAWADRLGFPIVAFDQPIWFHAASVGEAQSALTIIQAFCDNKEQLGLNTKFLLSVGTPAGLARAKNLAAGYDWLQILAPPLDFFGAPGRALDRIDPVALVIVETELWPELIRQAQKRALPVLVVAGRMSHRSFKRYGRARSLFQPLLAKMPLVAVIGDADRRRYLDLGAREEKTLVVGNPKFDSLVKDAKRPLIVTERQLGRKIIVAGSTEDPEEDLIVSAWLKLVDRPHLILAPRHLTRLDRIAFFLREKKITWRYYSARPTLDWPTEPDLILVDAYGVLAKLYGEADLAIIGGSFFGGSGHNPLEPTVYGRPVLFGPHMSSFQEESLALAAAGAAASVNKTEFSLALAAWLTRKDLAQAGQAGRAYLASQDLVGPKLASLVRATLAAP